MTGIIRKAKSQDVSGIKRVLESSELFPSEFLDDMMSDYLNNPESEDIWLVQSDREKINAFAYCAPEKFTNGTYNLYAIAVSKECQGSGMGKAMVTYIEDLLKSQSNRILLVETSSGGDYELTRQFYLKLNYTEEATIREFWDDGEDKVVFWKKLR